MDSLILQHRRRIWSPGSDGLWVCSLALLVRLCLIVWINSGVRVLPDSPMVSGYFERGYALSAGWGYVHAAADLPTYAPDPLRDLKARIDTGRFIATPQTVALPQAGLLEPFALHPPGLPLLIAGLHRCVAGPVDRQIQIMGALLDALTAWLVYLIGRRSLGREAGLFAALAYAFFMPVAYASVCKMPDGMMNVFVAGSLLVVMEAMRTTAMWRWAAYATTSGMILGLGSYVRPDYVAMPLALSPIFLACTRRLSRTVILVLAMQCGVLVVLSPWAWRNHEQSGRWIFTSTSPGATLIGGLGAFQNPWGFEAPDEDRVKLARKAGIGNPFSSEADVYFRKLFVSSVCDHPMAYAYSVLRRLPLAVLPPMSWGYNDPAKQMSFAQLREQGMDRYQAITAHAGALFRAYWDVLATSAVFAVLTGCVLALLWRERRHWPAVLLVLAPHLYSIAAHVLVHVEPRYMLPSVFCWLLAGGYVVALWCGYPVGFGVSATAESHCVTTEP